MKKYIVYKTTNLVNNKIYIGVHRIFNSDFDGYLGNGIYINQPNTYNKCKTLLLKAVSKYGTDNFKRETIATFTNEKDAYSMEASIVNKEFLQRKDVYNMCLGGTLQQYKSLKTYKYSNEGNLLEEFESIKEAATSVGADSETLRQAILYKIRCKNFFWSNNKYEILDLSTYNTGTKNSKKISIYAKSGVFILEFNSALDASKFCRCSNSQILRSAKLGYLISSNYRASFIKAETYDKAKNIYLNTQKVYLYSKEGEFIKEFNSFVEAQKECQGSNISASINHKHPCKNGYLWSIEKLPYYNISPKNKTKKVGRYDENGNLLETFKSIGECQKIWGKAVAHCIRGNREKHKNYIFKLIEMNSNLQ